MPSYDTNEGLTICPVTVHRDDNQNAHLRHTLDSRYAQLSTQGGLPIYPFTVHGDCRLYAQLWHTGTAADMLSHGSGHRYA